MSSFTYIDKDKNRALLILPGWGFHPMVIDHEQLDFDIIIPNTPILRPLSVVTQMLKKTKHIKLNILGWSLGARVALDTVSAAPELFEKTVLVSLPPPFEKTTVMEKLGQVERDMNKALKGFYLSVFQDNPKAYRRFKRHLEKLCLSFWSSKSLIEGLQMLTSPLPEDIEIENCLLIHGSRDPICPINSLPRLSKKGDGQKEVIFDCGHTPFLEPGFYDEINNF